MLARSVVFLVIILLIKVEAYPNEHGHKFNKEELKKQISKYVQQIIGDENLLESQPSFQHILKTVETMISRIPKCESGTKMELLKFAASNFGDFEGCINATRDIADFEQFGLHTYNYFKLTYNNLLHVAKAVFDCRGESNIFNVTKCVITTLENSGQQWDQIFDSATSLVVELQDDTTRIVQHIKSCFSRASIFEKALPLMYCAIQ